MIAIRIAKKDWGKAWRAMIEAGPVRLVADDPIYEVLPIHLEILNTRGYSYEIVNPPSDNKKGRRHAAADSKLRDLPASGG